MISTNAGGKLAHIDDQAAFMSAIERDHPLWQIVFIAEVDGRLAHADCSALSFGGRFTYTRHWPGPGSFAMAVITRATVSPFVKNIVPLGRCLRVQICVGSLPAPVASTTVQKNKFCVIFTHGSHSHPQETFTELSSLMNSRMRMAVTLLAGDFNVDLLPGSVGDPFAEKPGRAEHHADRRLLL